MQIYFKKWLESTLGTEEVDESQIDSAYANAKHAVKLVQLYDKTLPNNQKLLLNISTIATLTQKVYGLYNSKENKEVILNQANLKPEQLNKIKMTFGQDVIGKENIDNVPRDVIKGISLNVIKKYIPDINLTAFSPSNVIHVNVQEHLMKHKDPFVATLEIASTIVHESTHVLDFLNTNNSPESNAIAAEKRFKDWVKKNWNIIQQQIPFFKDFQLNIM